MRLSSATKRLLNLIFDTITLKRHPQLELACKIIRKANYGRAEMQNVEQWKNENKLKIRGTTYVFKEFNYVKCVNKYKDKT